MNMNDNRLVVKTTCYIWNIYISIRICYLILPFRDGMRSLGRLRYLTHSFLGHRSI